MIQITQDIRFKVEELVVKAGEAILHIYGKSHIQTETKSDFSPVTEADKASSRIINEGLSQLFPGVPVIDEENNLPSYEVRKTWEYCFLLDPLDGTKEFLKRNDEFTINLALLRENRLESSWLYHPVSRKGWYGKKNEGVALFGSLDIIAQKSVSTREHLVLVSSRSHPSPLIARMSELIGRKYEIKEVRLGSALKQAEIALGNADVYIRDMGCSEWDTAAGHLLVEESGGSVLQWDMEHTLEYNKPSIGNPPFIMLSAGCSLADFKELMNKLRNSLPRY